LAYPRLPVNSRCYDVAVDPKDAQHLWVAAQVSRPGELDHLLFESKNGGKSWSRPLPEPTDGVVAAGGNVVYTGSVRSRGLYVSTDAGRTWKRIDQGIAAGDARDGLVAQRLPGGGAGRRLVVLETPFGDNPIALFRSDGGKDWVKLPPQNPRSVVDAGGSTLVAVGGGGVIRSENGGDTWSLVLSAPFGFDLLSSVTRLQSMALLMFEDSGPYGNVVPWTSDDAGATWRRSSAGLPITCGHFASVDVCPRFAAYAVDPFDVTRRWISVTFDFFPPTPQLYVSKDSGTFWRLLTEDLPEVLALAADPVIKDRLLAGSTGGLFVSEDGGAHWLPLGTGLPDGAAIHQFARDARSATWYAATTDRGIYRSLDNGATWTLLAGAPDHDRPAIAVDPRRPTALLAAFAGQGVWRWTP
jgi:photosystem II stability/assembly factor-like uncharacterized protein